MDPRLRTPALRGDLAAVNRALDEGADPNLADADGYNPLIFACENNHVDCAARLIEAGARIDCNTREGRTPLNIASRYGHADMIRVLVAGGAQAMERAQVDLLSLAIDPSVLRKRGKLGGLVAVGVGEAGEVQVQVQMPHAHPLDS